MQNSDSLSCSPLSFSLSLSLCLSVCLSLFRLFDDKFHTDRVAKDLSEQLGDEANVMIDKFSGIRVKCGDTECVFEFVAYKYKGTSRDDDDDDESSDGDSNPPPNIIRSRKVLMKNVFCKFYW